MIGKSAFELKVWDDPSQRAALLQVLEDGGQVKNVDVCLRGKERKMLWGLLSADFIELEGRRYLITLVRDITDRKWAEEAIQKSEKRFAPALLFISSRPEGRYIDVNDTTLQTLGYERDEMIGRTASELNVWEDISDRTAML